MKEINIFQEVYPVDFFELFFNNIITEFTFPITFSALQILVRHAVDF